MKKTLMVITVLAVGLAAFGFVGTASAEVPSPLYPGNGGNGRGGSGTPGTSTGTGTGIPVEQNINLEGLLDDLMANFIADSLGITVDELKAREAAGETLVEIGLSLGFDIDSIMELHDLARTYALEQAVASGLITQEQADWLLSRLDLGQYGSITGTCVDDCTQTMVQTAQKTQQGNGRGRMNVKP